MELIINNLSLPPSVNKIWASVRGRLIKTIEGRQFDSKIELWIHRNYPFVQILRSECKKQIDLGNYLKVECFFVYHKNRIFWKTKGTIRQQDQNNRLKPALDAIAKIIDIDDTYFFINTAEKIQCKLLEDEQLIVKIGPCKMRNLEEIQTRDISQQR